MRQELIAGMIVVAFGLPMMAFANGRETLRELGALADMAHGNTTQFKAIWFPGAPEQDQPHVDAVASIIKMGNRSLAESRNAPQADTYNVLNTMKMDAPRAKVDAKLLATADLMSGRLVDVSDSFFTDLAVTDGKSTPLPRFASRTSATTAAVPAEAEATDSLSTASIETSVPVAADALPEATTSWDHPSMLANVDSDAVMADVVYVSADATVSAPVRAASPLPAVADASIMVGGFIMALPARGADTGLIDISGPSY